MSIAGAVGGSPLYSVVTLVNHDDYPREALFEALLRYVEEDLAADRD